MLNEALHTRDPKAISSSRRSQGSPASGLGEPTLAANLPELVASVRERVALPVLVLTGGALVPDAHVRRDLACFDQVVVTLNAPDEALFRQINRPARN